MSTLLPLVDMILSVTRPTLQVVLFPPSDLPFLYYRSRTKGSLKYSFPSHFTRDMDSVSASGRKVVFGSSVSLDKADLVRHPKYRYATPTRVLLEPGDVLYLPAFWHHEVGWKGVDMAKITA